MTLQTITDFLAVQGCTFPKVGLLQPADPFLDTAGEDLRRRIFMTQENSGKAFCLRPEFTIPVCLHHVAKGHGAARYGYGGTVFRQRQNAPAEFVQAGFEDFGNPDRTGADAASITTALDLLKASGTSLSHVIIGDQSVFVALLDALEMPPAWRKKLLRAFGDEAMLRAQLASIGENGHTMSDLPQDLRDALANGDAAAVLGLVRDRMIADGLPLTGGRTPQAISTRLMEHYQLRQTALPDKARKTLEAFLGLEAPLPEIRARLAGFEREFGIALPGAVEKLEALAAGLGSHAGHCVYRARFGRRLDYYTGLVFEVYRGDLDLPVIGGGRYDKLLTLLGAREEVPAVGFAVWVDRLEAGA